MKNKTINITIIILILNLIVPGIHSSNYSDKKNQIKKINYLIDQSFSLRKKNPEKCIKLSKKSLNLSSQLNFLKGIIGSYSNLGLGFYYKGEEKKALKFYQKALKFGRIHEQTDRFSSLYNNISLIYKKWGKFKKALEYQNKSLSIKQNSDNKRGIGISYNNMANIYYFMGEHLKAINYYRKAIEIKKELSDLQGLSKCYNNISFIFIRQGLYDKAIKYLYDSLLIKKRNGSKREISNTYNNLGLVYNKWKKYNKALEYFNKSLDIEKKLKDKNGIASCYNNIGLIFKNQKKYDTALNFYKKSLDLATLENNRYIKAGNYNNIAYIYEMKGKPNKALRNYFKSLKIVESLKNNEKKCSIYNNIGRIYSSIKQYEKAEKYLITSLNVATKNNYTEKIRTATELISGLYYLKNNYKLAYEYYKKFKKINDEIFNQKREKEIYKIQTQYKYAQEIKQNKILKLKIEKEKNIQRYLIIISLLIILSFLIFYNKYRFKKETNEILKEKNKEIRKMNLKLNDLAYYDHLTGLNNRRSFLKLAKKEAKRFGRSGHKFSFLMIDIDNFKKINDKLGHSGGDSILKQFTSKLKKETREQDLVSRWGGEEFLLLLPETAIKGAYKVASKIRKVIAGSKFNYKGNYIHLTITCGITEYSKEKDILKTINEADKALYEGKKDGKNCVKSYVDFESKKLF